MMNIEIRKTSTSEQNVSLRTIAYDIYIDGDYELTVDDLFDAYDYKEAKIDEQAWA